MVIECHAGEIEGVGLGRIASEFDDERLGVLTFMDGTDCRRVELIDYVLLILCIRRAEPLLGEQSWNAIFNQLVMIGKRWDCV